MRVQPFFTSVLLLQHLSVSGSRPQCFVCDKTFCNCSEHNLKVVPAAPSSVTVLDISFNSLEILKDGDFVTFGALKSLLMSNNRIEMIQDLAFVPLSILESLDLSMNQLRTLSPAWFTNLVSLRCLNLQGNEYETLGQSKLFQPLKELRSLYFGGHHLQSVGTTVFSGLNGLEDFFFDGTNLSDYGEGSFRQIGPISRVTLGLNSLFDRNQALVEVILSDVVHPNTTLTLIDTQITTIHQMFLLKVAVSQITAGLILKNVTMTPDACNALLLLLSGSRVSLLALEDVTFIHRLSRVWYVPNMNLKEVVLRSIKVPKFYSFPALVFMEPMMKAVKRVSLINSMFFAIPCAAATMFSKLEFLDLSDNIFSDLALRQMMCDGSGALWSLQTLNVSRNLLLTINSQLFSKLVALETIDMSGNAFQRMPDACLWPPSLRFLNLSSTHLTKVTSCLPGSLRLLDLSNNDLTVFDIELPLLTDLYISHNKMRSLPDGTLYPRLTSLLIQNNNLHTFASNNLNAYLSLRSLKAASNTFVCSCDFVAFMTSGVNTHGVRIGDELGSYACDSPYIMQGRSVAEVRLPLFECHMASACALLCSAVLAASLLLAVLCHRFSVLWYARMTWAWVRAKRKPRFARPELRYDVFVSYSEMDSGWVEAHLIPELEQSEPRLRLCLHRRDFVPGGWILDNIMDAIEKSQKTLFVLSQHFVRSEWCKYELDYTHFRLFDHNDDAVVLILLEPIDKNAIPKKFCKLRRVMNSRTYLEWPDDDGLMPRFWQSLREAINAPLADNVSLNGFNTD